MQRSYMRYAWVFSAFLLLALTTTVVAHAQTLTTLHNFCSQGLPCSDGFYPVGGLVQGTDGNFYGTTSCGGANPDPRGACFDLGGGTFFRITPAGALTTIYNFCSQPECSDGFFPTVSPTQGSNGALYGTTNLGGNSNCQLQGCGTILKMTLAGSLTTIYSFGNLPDAQGPQSSVIQGRDGSFYGTTVAGGANTTSCVEASIGCGTVFKIASDTTETTLYSFCSLADCADGVEPQAPLVQGSDGNFYGTTSAGGTNKAGTVFRITPTGTLTTLYSFCAQSACTDGQMPLAGLVQGNDGNFYGTTYCGGTTSVTLPACGGVGAGTVFKITSAGVLTTLYSFCQQSTCVDGLYPATGASLVLGSDGNFYGTTEDGGVYGGPDKNTGGTIFQITPTGTLRTLYSFCAQSNCSDGGSPMAPLVQAGDGNFYSIAWQGGSQGVGTVFRFSPTSGLATAFLTPPKLDFGGQVEGTTSAPQAITVTNTGTLNLTFVPGAVTISGTGASSFVIASDGCSGQTVAPNGTCVVNVTFNPSTTGSESATLSFADSAPNSPQIAALTGNGTTPDFSLTMASGSSSSATVSSGGTASYSLSLAPLGNFDQAVSLTCLGAPSEANCLVNPAIVTLNGTSASTVTVTVSTTAPSGVSPLGLINPPRSRGWPRSIVLGWLMLSVLVWLGAGRFGQRRFGRTSCPTARLRRLAPTAVVLAASLLTACGGSGGGNGGGNSGTPASTYKLTVTGTSGSLSHSITLTLKVS